MKRIITSALAIVLLAGAAQAQTTAPAAKGDRKEHRQEMAQLNLSADQKAKMKTIRESEKKELDAIRSNQSLTEEQRRTQGRQVHEKYRGQMNAVLTPDQQQKMAQFRQEWKDERGGPGGDRDTVRGHKGPGKGERGDRMAKMQQELNLTADQQQRMKSIRDQYRPQLEAIRNDNSLTPEQKKAKAKGIMKAQMDQMKTVLTPEQQQKMKSLHKGKGRKDGADAR